MAFITKVKSVVQSRVQYKNVRNCFWCIVYIRNYAIYLVELLLQLQNLLLQPGVLTTVIS